MKSSPKFNLRWGGRRYKVTCLSTRFAQQEVGCKGEMKFTAVGQETSRLFSALDLSNVYVVGVKVEKLKCINDRSTKTILCIHRTYQLED